MMPHGLNPIQAGWLEMLRLEGKDMPKPDEVLNTLDKILPIGKFLSKDKDGVYYMDWEKVDAADFKDCASQFAEAMVLVANTVHDARRP
jgi:hypothetical protein